MCFHVKSPTGLELGELCARHGLGTRQEGQLAALLEGLASDEHAPTSVRGCEDALALHIADSLSALELAVLGRRARIVDVGSGAGFPGLALAVALPRSELTLLESQARRCRFIEAQITRAGVANARVVCARAEEWREGLRAQDVALARAVGPTALVLEYAAPLLRRGGALIDWRGRREPAEEEVAERVGPVLGLERAEIRRVEPFPGAREHNLHLYVKVQDTPERFPRRAGIARKRPIQ